MRSLLLILIALSLCIPCYARVTAPIGRLQIEEEDGAPTGRARILKVSDDTLTDNGDGSFSLAIPSAAADTEWDGIADNDVVMGDIPYKFKGGIRGFQFDNNADGKVDIEFLTSNVILISGAVGIIQFPVSNNPIVNTEHEMTYDANGGGWGGWLRMYDAPFQKVLGKVDKEFTWIVTDPINLTEASAQTIWHNRTGADFVIEEIQFRANEANQDGVIQEISSNNFTARTTIVTFTVSNNLTGWWGLDALSTGGLEHNIIENEHMLTLDNGSVSSDSLTITFKGFLNGAKP